MAKNKLPCFFIICMSLLVQSHSISNVQKSENETVANGSSKAPEPKIQERDLIEDSLKPSNPSIGIPFILASLLTLFSSTILLSLIWRYLKNLSITKSCLLLYLYKDAIATTLLASYVWIIIIFSCYYDSEGFMTNLVHATILSMILISIELELLLILNLVSIIKLYTMKEKVIDPPMPWGDGDDKASNRIRVMNAVSITLFVSIMYAEGFYPKAYYYFIGDHTPLLELSNGPKIFEGVLGILFIIPTITIILTIFYHQTEEQAQATRREGKVYFLVVILIFIMVAGVIYGAFSDKLGHFLIFGQCLLTVANVITPFIVILSSPPLKSFVRKVASDFTSSFVGRMEHFRSRISNLINVSQRSNQIVPIV